jgi:hypothetical protein
LIGITLLVVVDERKEKGIGFKRTLPILGFLIRHPHSSCSRMLVKGTPVI